MEIFYAYQARINKIIIHVLHGLMGSDEDLDLTEIQIRDDPTHKHIFVCGPLDGDWIKWCICAGQGAGDRVLLSASLCRFTTFQGYDSFFFHSIFIVAD